MRDSILAVTVFVASSAVVLLLATGCATGTAIPPNATDAEVDSYIGSQLALLGGPGSAKPPDAVTVAYTTTDTWSTVQTSCLQAAGLQAREISGGYTIDGSGGLSDAAVSTAQLVCLREYPVDPRVEGFLSSEQVLFMYDYFTHRLAPCLASLGFDVPLPPPRAEYLQHVRAGNAWNPYYRAYLAPIATSPAEWARIMAQCPALPDDPFGSYRPAQSRVGSAK